MESISCDPKTADLEGAKADVPLAVDLDGTLVKTDLLIESLVALVKRNPLYLFIIPFWLLKGKSYLKRQTGRRAGLDVSSLPYHLELLTYLNVQREQGRRLVMATAADQGIARQIGDYLHLFDLIFASDGQRNLAGARKKDLLVEKFGLHGFDYAGNSRADLIVWQAARKAIVVDSDPHVRRFAGRVAEVEQVFEDRRGGIKYYLQELRFHHWLKNLLVFVPLLAAHRVQEAALLAKALLAFTSFGLCASSVYILNDLLDLPEDRRHPRRRQRPFAAGRISLLSGLALIPALLGLSILISLPLPRTFMAMLAVYFATTLVYSFGLKQIVLMDVIVLAGLFTVRMIAGSAAVDIWPSSWLLTFSMFIFLSLALVKRYAELVTVRNERGENARTRGYMVIDRELLAAMGCASGFVAVLVLSLYISSGQAQMLYGRRQVIWLVCPSLLFWISYLWLIAHRGKMHDDPLVFAIRDPLSLITILLMAAIMTLAI